MALTSTWLEGRSSLSAKDYRRYTTLDGATMRTELRELYKYRELLVMLAIRDIKVRYKQSIMGFLWAILLPMLIITSGVVVRYGYAFESKKPPNLADVIDVATKSVPWAFVVSSIRFSCQSLTGNPNLVTKVYFPKEVFPIGAVLSQLFDLFISSSLLILLFVVAKVGLTLELLWAGPLLVILIMMAVGIGLLVSAGSLFYRDVRYLVEVFLNFAIFFTPVFYTVKMFGQKGRWLLLNPVAPILEGFSSLTRGQTPDWNWVFYSLAFGTLTLYFAYVLFKKVEPLFAQNI
jgi:lipopolysaccharide transport system permease protein